MISAMFFGMLSFIIELQELYLIIRFPTGTGGIDCREKYRQLSYVFGNFKRKESGVLFFGQDEAAEWVKRDCSTNLHLVHYTV